MSSRTESERTGGITHLAARAVPVVVAIGVAFGLARFAPYWVLGIDRRLWWLGVFGIANTCLVLGDNLRARLMQSRTAD